MTSTEVRSVSSTGGEKGTKDARFDLLPIVPLTQVATHYGIGARKYAARNWERGYEWSKSYAALQRHAHAFWGGENIDEETGSPHMAAVAFHALALLEFSVTHPEFDDRATSGAVSAEEWNRAAETYSQHVAALAHPRLVDSDGDYYDWLQKDVQTPGYYREFKGGGYNTMVMFADKAEITEGYGVTVQVAE